MTEVKTQELSDEKIRELAFTGVPGYDPAVGAEDFVFSLATARKAIEFFPRKLRHCKGPLVREPFELLPWQKALIANLYGWRKLSNQKIRRYNQAFVYIPKKNGKSAMSAAICHLEMALCEHGAEIYSAASSLEQSGNVFDHFKGQASLTRSLYEKYEWFGGDGGNHKRGAIIRTDEGVKARYVCIAAKEKTADGGNPTFVIIDELHRMVTPEQQNFVDIMYSGTVAREDFLIVYTTTAADTEPGPCNTTYEYAKGVRDGVVDNARFLPVIYETLPNDDWESEEVWRKANPSLGHTVLVDGFREQYQKAKAIPHKKAHFLRFHLNLRCSTEPVWLNLNKWLALSRQMAIEDFAGKECIIAVDLASCQDLAALVAVFRRGREYFAFPHFWIPEETVERHEKESGAPYTYWRDEGFLQTEPGEHMSFHSVRDLIVEYADRFKVREVVLDPRFAQWLQSEVEAYVPEVVRFLQTHANYNPAVEEAEKLIGLGRLAHPGHPILDWNASHVVLAENPGGLRMPFKGKSKEQKIDGIVALLMALARWISKGPKRGSVYGRRGLWE